MAVHLRVAQSRGREYFVSLEGGLLCCSESHEYHLRTLAKSGQFLTLPGHPLSSSLFPFPLLLFLLRVVMFVVVAAAGWLLYGLLAPYFRPEPWRDPRFDVTSCR